MERRVQKRRGGWRRENQQWRKENREIRERRRKKGRGGLGERKGISSRREGEREEDGPCRKREKWEKEENGKNRE